MYVFMCLCMCVSPSGHVLVIGAWTKICGSWLGPSNYLLSVNNHEASSQNPSPCISLLEVCQRARTEEKEQRGLMNW